MNSAQLEKIQQYISDNIQAFHARRLEKLSEFKLDKTLKRVNPYLYRAKNLELAHDFVKYFTDNYLALQERTIFGMFLEELALFVGDELCGGKKSGIEGVDLEFSRDKIHYLVSIKSGPNWGNSSEVKKQRECFHKAARVIRQSKSVKAVAAVLGCCYGRESVADKGDYIKLCGQSFWQFLSGHKNLYLDIIEPLGHQAKQRNHAFHKEYTALLNQSTQKFMNDFCINGKIDWKKLTEFSSASPTAITQKSKPHG